MGTHIEMSHTLPVTVEDLCALGERLELAGAEPKQIAMSKFAVAPIGAFQRVVGSVLKWFVQ